MCLYILLRIYKKDGFLHKFLWKSGKKAGFVYMDKLAQTLHYIKAGVKNANK